MHVIVARDDDPDKMADPDTFGATRDPGDRL
jgi:hypothetical protein